MIYVTGDTHADFARFANKRMRENGLQLTADDYVIVCGDFGLCWSNDGTFKYHCNNFKEKPYTILWVQGNHENYDMIATFPLEEWNGGKVRHIVRDKIILLERGQVFTIQGKTFFTFGGASSHDISDGILDPDDEDFAETKRRYRREGKMMYRVLHQSWWPEELPSEEEMAEGIKNLEKVDYKVDYVITHCAPTEVQSRLDAGPGKLYHPDYLTDYLQEISEKLEFKQWYFGHYHDTRVLSGGYTLLYKDIVPLGAN